MAVQKGLTTYTPTIFSTTGFAEEEIKAPGGPTIEVSEGTVQRLGTLEGF